MKIERIDDGYARGQIKQYDDNNNLLCVIERDGIYGLEKTFKYENGKLVHIEEKDEDGHITCIPVSKEMNKTEKNKKTGQTKKADPKNKLVFVKIVKRKDGSVLEFEHDENGALLGCIKRDIDGKILSVSGPKYNKIKKANTVGPNLSAMKNKTR